MTQRASFLHNRQAHDFVVFTAAMLFQLYFATKVHAFAYIMHLYIKLENLFCFQLPQCDQIDMYVCNVCTM